MRAIVGFIQHLLEIWKQIFWIKIISFFVKFNASWKIGAGFIVFLFFLHFASPAFAVNPVINPLSIDTLIPVIGDAFNVTATMSGALSGSSYYVKCRIGASSSSLNDGQTYNLQTLQWLDDTGSTGAWVNMPQITTGADGLWQDSVKCRIKTSANDEAKVIFIRACLNSDSSCETSFQSVNSLTVNPIFPTSTPTPTPTNTPTPTPTPTFSPTNTPTKTPTPIPTKISAPTSKPATSPTSPNSVLGESIDNGLDISPPENDLIANTAKKPDNLFQGIVFILGIVLIVACGILTFRIIKKGESVPNEEE